MYSHGPIPTKNQIEWYLKYLNYQVQDFHQTSNLYLAYIQTSNNNLYLAYIQINRNHSI